MVKFLQPILLYRKSSSDKDLTLQVKMFHLITLFDWEFSITKILGRFNFTSNVREPFAYACPENCGCIWRDNKDGTMSLFGKRSQSCEICEFLPLSKLVPLYHDLPPISREQIAFCFRQATQAGRFSEGYCIDRILDLVKGAKG